VITDLLVEHARSRPDAAFLRTDGGSYSFGQILPAVQRLAHRLQRHGVARGDHVALLAGNGVPYVVAMLAANWLGAVTVALNNELVADGLCYTLAQSDSRLLVADARWVRDKRHHLDEALKRLPMLVLPDEAELFASLQEEPEASCGRVAGSATCTILYTSGTTGLPKGVVNSHDCYLAVGKDTSDALQLTGEDRIMVFLPLFHTNPQMYALMSALTTGCSLILRERFSVTTFFDDARRFGATGFTFVGTVMSILVIRHPDPVTDHGLRFAIGGGTPVKVWEAAHARFGFRIHELYGMTEIGGWVSCNTLEHYRLGSCGRMRASMDVRIFDENDMEVPPDVPGEIVVRPLRPNVILSGYYRKPEALVECSRNFWFHTGDRGSIDAEGFLYFHGRAKELIRRGGEMISPVEIETHLRLMPGVADCAVVGVDDPVMGEEIKVVVVMETPVPPSTVVRHLTSLVPKYMLPRFVEFIDRIPKTETEKVQRNKLQYVRAGVHDLKALESS